MYRRKYSGIVYLRTPRPPKEVHFPWKTIKVVAIILIIFGLAYSLFFSSLFDIEKIKVEGTANQNIISLTDAAKGRNLWLYKSANLKEQILKYAEVSDVSIRKWPLKTLKVSVKEKTEGIIWITEGKKYLLDNQGVAIREITESQLPQVVDEKNAPVELSKKIVSPSFVNFIKNLNSKFNAKTGLPLKEIEITAETTFELTVITEKFKVIFDTQGNLDQQLDNLNRVYQMKKEEVKEYMDLRVAGRVYYK